jgi:hypothetical protein
MELETFNCDECSHSVAKAELSRSRVRLWEHFLRHHAFSASALRQRAQLNEAAQASRLRHKLQGACDQCGSRFNGKDSMHRHIRGFHDETTPRAKFRLRLQCDDGHHSVRQAGHMIAHTRGFHNKTIPNGRSKFRAQCDDCHHLVHGTHDLASHWLSAHSLLGRPKLPPRRPKINCDQCSHTGLKEGIWRHWVRQHSGLSHSGLQKLLQRLRSHFSCDSCQEALGEKKLLPRHLVKRHGLALHLPKRRRGSAPRGACDECGRQANLRHLADHWRRRHADLR